MSKKWYVVHTYSGYENRAKMALEERIRQTKMEDAFEEILIPAEEPPMVAGKRKGKGKKFFPGYMLVRMDLTDDAWHLIKGTPKVTGFVGGATNPPSISDEEVERLTNRIQSGEMQATPESLYDAGDNIRVTAGPFAGFSGIIEDVNPEKGRLRVLVSIFGRATAVELNLDQVEKA